MKQLIDNLCEQKQIEQRFLLKGFMEDFFTKNQTQQDSKNWIERFDNHLKSSMESSVAQYVDFLELGIKHNEIMEKIFGK